MRFARREDAEASIGARETDHHAWKGRLPRSTEHGFAPLRAAEPPAAAQGPSREELLKLTTDFLADKPDASALQLAVVLFLDGNVTEADIAATRKWLADEASKQGGKT